MKKLLFTKPFTKKEEILKKEKTIWEPRFHALAEYNSEVGRGIVHTEKFDKAMSILQSEYNEKVKAWAEKNGYKIV